MPRTLPVTLIGGYLGAGKTTLVNAMLRHAQGRRLAVLVNEFGALPIDGDLIEAQGDDLISISGGCICCSFGSDLIAALAELRARNAAIDHILIETSGVALPGAIVASLQLVPGIAIDAVIVLADAETIEARASDRYMSDTVRGQLEGADLVVLNKIDLVTSERAAAISRWLAGAVPGARLIPVSHAAVPLDLVLGVDVRSRLLPDKPQRPAHQTSDYATLSLEIDQAVDAGPFAAALTDPRLGLLRAKGFLRGRDGGLTSLHLVGRRSHLEPAPAWVEGRGRIVCIGLAAQLDRMAIRAAVRQLADRAELA